MDEEDHEYATALGGPLSRTVGDRAAFTYSTAGCLEHVEHGHDVPGCLDATPVGIESNTLLVGLSTRLRLTPGIYVVGSWTPRASGFRTGVSLKTFGIEKRLRGHVSHLNVSNREVLLSSADLQVGVSSPSPTDRESRRPRSPWCAR